MLTYAEDDIVRWCGPNATKAGRTYLTQGRVIECAREGDRIRSLVRGTEPRPYRQDIQVSGTKGRTSSIRGTCTCYVGQDCKHVAAALLKSLADARAATQQRSADPTVGVPAPDGLSKAARAWLDELGIAEETSGEDYPPGMAERVVYVLRPANGAYGRTRVVATPMRATLQGDGTYARGKPFDPNVANQPTASQPRCLRPSDARILRDLAKSPNAGTHIHSLHEEAGHGVLSEILRTGRARLLQPDGPALSEGPPRPGSVFWEGIDGGSVIPRVVLDDGGTAHAGTPPVYIDGRAGLVGVVETGHPARVVGALLKAPPLDHQAIGLLHARTAGKPTSLGRLLPRRPTTERVTGTAPVPCVRLFTVGIQVDLDGAHGHHRYGTPEVETVSLARLSFRYGTETIPYGETRDTVTRYSDGRLVEVDRDAASEGAALSLLLAQGFESFRDLWQDVPEANLRDFALEGDDALTWAETLHRAIPALEGAGWEIAIAPDFPLVIVKSDGDFDAEVREGSGIDWLELHLGIQVDGERVDLVRPIVEMISKTGFDLAHLDALASDGAETMFVPLGDGRTLAMPMERLRPIIGAIHDMAVGSDLGPSSLRLGRLDAARLAEFEAATGAAAVRWRGGEAVRSLGRQLADNAGIPPVDVPPGFLATLRPYQREGVAWLSLLRDVGLGGILADDMGLGKTVQALAFLCIEKAAGRLDRPALVVAPTSLMANWAREAARFAPALRVLTLHGPARKGAFPSIPSHDLVLTTYPLVARDRATLAAQGWHVLMLDEAQTIKNPEATTTKTILTLDARHRFCLTGTPLENNLGELWSLFSFATPGLLGDRRGFATTWRTPVERNGDAERGRLLARRVRPFLLRRTKVQVAKDLPPKTTMVERIEFEPAQRDAYEAIRLAMHDKVRRAIADKGWGRSRIVVLEALLRLRQACCDPRLLKVAGSEAGTAGSAKLERLEEMLRELLAEGRRVLVFSQFTSMLDLIRPRLAAAGITHSVLTGSTRDRPAAIADFDEGRSQVFLISLKAGGVGLNLVSADTVILYDPWWNPAVEDQAVDRAHRIGQDKPVFVHKLVAADTIEEKMEVLKERKAALAESLFDPDGETTLGLTEADVEMLLAA